MNSTLTLSKIKKQYEAICDILKDCHTIEDARRLEKDLDLIIEVGSFNDYDAGHCTLEKFDNLTPEQIDWFRVEAWENLGYVYYYTNGSTPYFNVYEDNGDDVVIEDATIETLENDLQFVR